MLSTFIALLLLPKARADDLDQYRDHFRIGMEIELKASLLKKIVRTERYPLFRTVSANFLTSADGWKAMEVALNRRGGPGWSLPLRGDW